MKMIAFKDGEMKNRAFTLLLLGLLSMMGLSGAACRRSDTPEAPAAATGEALKIAESDYKPAGQAGDANSIVDPGASADKADLPAREEIRRNYSFKPGNEVSISRINGSIAIETADIDHAELLVVRSAKTKEDLQYRKIQIEHTPGSLSIGVESDRKSVFSAFGKIPEGRQRVILKIPVKARLEVNGTNGPLTVSEIDGKIDIRGVNGATRIAGVSGSFEARGFNGELTANFRKLGPDGIDISGYNGEVNLNFSSELNANFEMRGVNGELVNEIPNFKADEEAKRRRTTSGKFGEGGPEIAIRGGNGRVKMTSTASAAKSKQDKPAKSAR